MNWNDIKYRQLLAIKDANDIYDETEKGIAVITAVFGEDALNLSVSEFNKLAHQLDFLKTEVPTTLGIKGCKVNNREYVFDGLLGRVTAAQYLDFQNYLRSNNEEKSFSVFFIPKGHTYNDGYDMNQVFEDILDMPVPVLYSASFFFIRQLKLSIKIFQRYSTQQMKKMKLPKETKESLMKITESLNSLESYLLS